MRTPKPSSHSNSQQLSNSTVLAAPHVHSEGTLIQMKPQKERDLVSRKNQGKQQTETVRWQRVSFLKKKKKLSLVNLTNYNHIHTISRHHPNKRPTKLKKKSQAQEQELRNTILVSPAPSCDPEVQTAVQSAPCPWRARLTGLSQVQNWRHTTGLPWEDRDTVSVSNSWLIYTMTGRCPSRSAFPFDREGENTLQTTSALERIKCTGPETHGEDSAGGAPSPLCPSF